MVRGIVVDVDDTLLLERDYVRSGFAAIEAWCLEDFRVAGVGQAAWKLFEGGHRATTITDAMAACGIRVSPETRKRAVEVYRTHDPDIVMHADAADFLARHRATHRIGVLTDGPWQSQQAKCRALGLDVEADLIVLSDFTGDQKPATALYRRFEDAWSLAGPELVYVADNPAKDFVALDSLGWAGVRIRRPGSLHEDLPTPPGLMELASLEELDFT